MAAATCGCPCAIVSRIRIRRTRRQLLPRLRRRRHSAAGPWKQRERERGGGEKVLRAEWRCGRAKESDNNKLMLLFIKCDEWGVSASKCNYSPSPLHSSMPFPFHLHVSLSSVQGPTLWNPFLAHWAKVRLIDIKIILLKALKSYNFKLI